MSLNKSEKQVVVTDVAAEAARSQTLALAEYRGLTVAHLDVLRRTARDKGVYLHVLKNTLARRAVAGTPFEVASESMVGPLIYGFSQDAVAAAKVIADFAKGNDKLVGNLRALIEALNKAKPAASKGIYLRKVALSSTMGVGVRVDAASINAAPAQA